MIGRALVLAALLLAGCSSGGHPAASAAPSTSSSPRAAFLSELYNEKVDAAKGIVFEYSDRRLVADGERVCRYIAKHGTSTIVSVLVRESWDPVQAAALAHAARAHLCP